jgi:hypothetical protein
MLLYGMNARNESKRQYRITAAKIKFKRCMAKHSWMDHNKTADTKEMKSRIHIGRNFKI